MRPTVMIVMGTRPEAIKLAPVVEALQNDGLLVPFLVGTSQHREMLPQALRPFGLVPDVNLGVMRAQQTPVEVAARVMQGLEPLLAEKQPAWVVVQGDTTSTFAAAVAAFYGGFRIAHVEAGLRTGRLDVPFPEEFNRKATAVATGLHFAPTQRAARNLLAEGVPSEAVLVVGNTVVDAVHAIRSASAPHHVARSAELATILVTLHRRESWGEPMRRVLVALRRILDARAGKVRLVLPVHPNPAVASVVKRALSGVPGVELVAPMDYPDFLELFARSRFVISDSGGVQEEAPTLGVPVLITRELTERPEVVESGWGRVVGTDEDRIVAEALRLLDDDSALAAMKAGANPFGDGHSGKRIARALADRA